ncbi:hypothetical protein [Cohnella caldifontis]|uniref:hypothetical protein n=1 Tax=Cohnella caldifontis TaxID=3027471 RepID=UPI0023EB5A2D|nr:hypothetical protein [Cohnella sp. YIM B05605]
MRKPGRLLSLLLALCLMMTFSSQLTFAEGTGNDYELQKVVSLGKVKLQDDVTADVNNLMMVPSDNTNVIAVTLSINNNSNSQLNLLDYWINLYTKSGTKLSVQMVDNQKNNVPAKTTQDFIFYSKVGANIKLTDLVIKVIKWDFSVENYSRVLGQISVPQRYSPVTTSNLGRVISTGENQASFIIKQAVMGKSEQYYRPSLTIGIKNEGRSTITLPDYQLYIRTANNLLYPLTAAGLKGTVLDPLTDKEYQLSTSIPLSVQEGKWTLVLVLPINEGKDKIPVAEFDLPKASSEVATDVGKFYSFSNAEGVYYVKLNSMNRLPIEDNDLIVSNITIQNKGNDTLSIPALTGKYVFNDKIEKSVTVTINNKQIALAPGAAIDLQVVGKVPYTFDISKVKLVLQQKDSTNSTVTDLVAFTNAGEFQPVTTVNWDKGFQIKDVGYRSEVKVRNLMRFSGTGGDILAAQMTVANQEKRMADMQPLAGYFEKEDGTVYAVTFKNVEEKLNPGGGALIYAWASIPKDMKLDGLKLVVGKAVIETTPASDNSQSGSTVVTGYVSPYSFQLPAERTAQTGLKNIDLYPYQLTINRVRTRMDFQNSSVSLDFDYTLQQDLLTKADTKDHKVIIELKDEDEEIVFNRSLTLSNTTSGSSTDDPTLNVGTRKIELSPWVSYDFVANMQTVGEFYFNVYYEIQSGYRILVASEKLPWLVDRTLNP